MADAKNTTPDKVPEPTPTGPTFYGCIYRYFGTTMMEVKSETDDRLEYKDVPFNIYSFQISEVSMERNVERETIFIQRMFSLIAQWSTNKNQNDFFLIELPYLIASRQIEKLYEWMNQDIEIVERFVFDNPDEAVAILKSKVAALNNQTQPDDKDKEIDLIDSTTPIDEQI